MGLIETLLEHVSLRTIVGFALFALVSRWVVSRILEHVKIKRMGYYAKSYPTYAPLGLDFIYKTVKSALVNENHLFWRDQLFKANDAWTVESRILGVRILFTAEPENIKAILATQFSDFGKGEPFHKDWQDFLGDSIFTTDGSQWHDSRQLIRPQFSKDRVSDLECFETHMDTLFRAMANGGALNGADQQVNLADADGKIIDISDLFFRYTLDVATEFLLGHDVQSLR